MGYDVYGLNPKNVEYLEANHPGDFDFSKSQVNSPEYKEWRHKEWTAEATSGVYFRQSVGGYWGVLMYWAQKIIKDLPNSIMFNEGYVINEEDAIKIADYIEDLLSKDEFKESIAEFLTTRYNDDRDKGYYGDMPELTMEILDEKVNEMSHIVSTFVKFAKNSGGFRIS